MANHGAKSKRVRRSLEENPEIVSDMSYRKLAKMLGVKKSTVLVKIARDITIHERIARRLG